MSHIAPHSTDTLASAGEQVTIATIRAQAPSTRNGDDAAVLSHGAPNSRTVISTDLLIEGQHFRQDWSTPKELGQKAVTQNFADIEAMGARPVAILLGLSAPGETPLSFVEELARGIAQRCAIYGGELVGGDVTRSSQIVIAITAVGQLGGSLPALTQDAARPGQKVIASGPIGESAAGLALLSALGRENIPAQFTPLIEAHCSALVPPGRGVVARSAGVAAMTDNSDGLIVDLGTIAKKSDVAIDLDPLAIAPTQLMKEAGALLGIDPWEWVLTGGEDHTLLGTTAHAAPTGFTVIGQVKKPCPGISHTAQLPVTIAEEKPRYTNGWESF